MIDIQFNTLSNEIKLALLCSSVKIDKPDFDRIKHLSAQNIDWEFFKILIIQNRIYPIVYKNLKFIEESIPVNLMSELKKMVVLTGTSNFIHTVFLQRLVAVFKEKRIFMLPFKGPVLAEQLYKDIILRPFSDLDILVDKSDAVQAFNLFKEQDLIAQLDLKKSQFEKYVNDEDHFVFYDFKNKITIELHWELSGLYLSNPITVSDLKEQIITGNINDIDIPCLSSEVLLVYLCIHGAKHGWCYLEQLCCVAELIKTDQNLDWRKIKNIASDWKCKNMLLLGMFLIKTLLKVNVPENICATKNNDIVARMSIEVIDNMFNKAHNSHKKGISDRFSLFHIRIRDSIIDKIRYSLRLIFRPTDKEWLYFPVPACISFVHYFLRPCRLIIGKLMRSMYTPKL